MKPLRTLILAAGRGVRMNSDLPKVLHSVCGRPMIQYSIELAQAVGSLKIYSILGFKSEVVQKALPPDVEVVIQKKLLGTADAIKSAYHYFKSFSGDVLILSGDTPLLTEDVIKSLLKKHRDTKAVGTFLTAQVVNPSGYGRIIRDEAGRIMAIREDKNASLKEKAINEINVGLYIFDSQLLFQMLKRVKINPVKKEYYLTDVIELLSKEILKIETVQAAHYQDGLGVNNKEDLAFAESVIRQRVLTQFLKQGITIVDPQTTYIDRDVTIGQDTTIRPFCLIERDVKIGKKCQIGPFCRIRPGSRIEDGVELGNFTELSRTSIGAQSIMKHFSFLGDAQVGAKVNIGAGTITANYDGVNKNKTIIEDEAFIGSDSILIAPVKVGRKATVAAGAVVTKGQEIPAQGLALGMPARIVTRRKR